MRTRVISGAVLGVLCVGLGLLGGPFLGLTIMFCGMVGYYELTRALHVFEEGHYNHLFYAGEVCVVAYYLIVICMQAIMEQDAFIDSVCKVIALAVIFLVLLMMATYVLTFPRYHADQIIDSIFSFVYCPLMLSFVFLSRCLPYGIFIYTMIFLCSWICDTGAYFTGRAFGRHKLAPVLSPKKTIEGSVGGVVFSVVFCILEALLMHVLFPEETLIWQFALIGLFGSIFSQIGDLAASAIKRNHGIKDYGTLIPGHGGIMDRFDSVIFVSPLIFFLGLLFVSIL